MENNKFDKFYSKNSVDELLNKILLHNNSTQRLDKEWLEGLKKHLLERDLTNEQKQLYEEYISNESKIIMQDKEQEIDSNQIEKKGPDGIGGWLILVVIGLFVSIIRIGISIFTDILPLLDKLDSISNHGGIGALIYFELIINSIFVLYAIVLLILMFNYSRFFPRFIIVFYISNLVFVILDLILVSNNPILGQIKLGGVTYSELLRSIIGTSIWVPYILMSKRVKNTFIQ